MSAPEFDSCIIECDVCGAKALVETTDPKLALESAVDHGWLHSREIWWAQKGHQEVIEIHRCPTCAKIRTEIPQ